MRIKTNYSHILLNTLISRKLKLLANRCRFALPIFEEKYKVIINTSDMCCYYGLSFAVVILLATI